MKNIMPLCLGLMLIILATPAWANTQNDAPLELVSFAYPPYISENYDVNTGLVELYLDQLMRHAKQPYRLTLMPPKRAVLHTLNTPNTCVFPIEKSQERESQFQWISPILISRLGLFQTQDSPAIEGKVLKDFLPYRVGSYLGSATGNYLESLGFAVDYAAKNEANLLKMHAGRIDLWASDVSTALHISRQKNLKISQPRLEFFTTLRAIGCNKTVSPELVFKLQTELEQMYKNGEIEHIKHNFYN